MSFFIPHTGSRLLQRSQFRVVAPDEVFCFWLLSTPAPASCARAMTQIAGA
jgi:hypothetical protein